MEKIKDIIDSIKRLLKNNTAIILPAAIAAVAVLLFLPTLMMKGKISDKLDESLQTARQIESAQRTAVSLAQPEVEKQYQDKHGSDANAIKQLAVESTQRELLSYKIFPSPAETSVQIFNEFKNEYTDTFVKMVEDMNALDAPSDIEISKEAGSAEAATSTRGRDRFSVSSRSSRSARDDQGADEKIIELICKRRSEKIPVYASPQVFSGYGFWDNWEYFGIENAARDCWYCQLACWIHSDIAETINTVNAGSKSVSDSSVKRLLGVRFSTAEAAVLTAAAAGASNATELPVYAVAENGLLSTNWTRRITNENIDIVHFSVAVVVRADDVLKFMDVLCSEKEHYFAGYDGKEQRRKLKHNQITILQSAIEPVEKQDDLHRRYRYGPDAVVKLNLVCEYLFYKEGYQQIKPESVRAVTEAAAQDSGRRSRRR